jgi:hypothetical protein
MTDGRAIRPLTAKLQLTTVILHEPPQQLRPRHLFWVQHKFGYDHDVGFSQGGQDFKPGLHHIDEDAIPVIYELVNKTYPEKATALKEMLTDYRGAEGLELLRLQPNSYVEALSTRRNKRPKKVNRDG